MMARSAVAVEPAALGDPAGGRSTRHELEPVKNRVVERTCDLHRAQLSRRAAEAHVAGCRYGKAPVGAERRGKGVTK